jgi:hypothetical protein
MLYFYTQINLPYVFGLALRDNFVTPLKRYLAATQSAHAATAGVNVRGTTP